jgi:hypothetical protein
MKYLLMLLCLALSACATDYKTYSDAVAGIETARHQADAERYKALAVLGSGSDVARVAAVMSMQHMGAQQPAGTSLRAPESAGDTLLRWTGTILQTGLQAYGIRTGAQLGMRQSDNATAIAQSTNATMLGIAGKIQAPAPAAAPIIPQANVTTTYANVSNANVTTTDRHDVAGSHNQRTSDSGNTVTPTTITGSYNTDTTTTSTADSNNSTVAPITTTTTTTSTVAPVTNTTTDASNQGNNTSTTLPPVAP